MGALHLVFHPIEDVAVRGGWAVGGPLLAVDLAASTVEVRVEERLSRALPEPARGPARWWRRWRPAGPPEPPRNARLAVSPPPVATDAHSHPIFVRIEGEVPLHALRPGERVWVATGVGCAAVLGDAPLGGDRIRAAFDRRPDLAWAERAPPDELHAALLDRRRADVALAELRWRRALALEELAARRPLTDLPTLLAHAHPEPRVRQRLIEAAAARLASSPDRTTLHAVTEALFDRVGLQELLPLLMQVDPADPAAVRVATFARIRLEHVVREEPHREPVFAAARARFGVHG